MANRQSALALSVIFAVLVSGCSTLLPKSDEYAELEPRSETVLEVENNNWSDMVVYAVYQGTRTRLGTVTSMRTERLRIPGPLISTGGDLRLMVSPIGARWTYTSDPLYIREGGRIQWRLENHIQLSSLIIRH